MVFFCMGQLGAIAEEPDRASLDFFEKRIRPVLVDSCYSCHSVEAAKSGKLKGGLQLDTRAGLLRGGESGAAVTPGKPEESLLLEALRYESFEMPPKGKLPDQVLADFEKWIADGAVDPRDGAAFTAAGIDFAKAREYWSLRPIVRPTPPTDADTDWPQTPIDQFAWRQMQQYGLQPAGPANSVRLLRRLYFDLSGLPPTPAEIVAFEAAAAEDRSAAIAATVDRLLASPHFGERWGRHWLDVVRFAESNGRDFNLMWHDAWRYRNWVIDAFNADMPFDEFTRWQIAGDLLPSDSAKERDDQIIATGVLAMAPKTIAELNPNIFEMDMIDEQIELIGRSFLGLSISCARCHDHKFDPIPTKDYYALAGVLRSSKPLYGFARLGAKRSIHSTLAAIGPQADALNDSAQTFRQELIEQHLDFQTARSARYRVVRNVASAKLQLKKPDADAVALNAQIKEW